MLWCDVHITWIEGSHFSSTVEALVSDNLGSSKKWSELELVAHKHELSQPIAW